MFSANTSQVAAGAGAVNYIEDVFSTYLYTGNGSTQTITNGIDLSTKGGLVWAKQRNGVTYHQLRDTVRGGGLELYSNDTSGQLGSSAAYTFLSTGYSIGGNDDINLNTQTYASWTFRKQPKFFDVVTFTTASNGSATVSHALGSTPAFVIVKRTDSTGLWFCWHTSLPSTNYYLFLNTTSAQTNSGGTWLTPSSTQVSFPSNTSTGALDSSANYVMYVYASNAGGFGLTGTDNVISCGSVAVTGSAQSVSLGYEPQWILWRKSSGSDSWWMFDTMRGLVVDNASGTGDKYLYANSSAAEAGTYGIDPTATGFNLAAGWGAGDYIYIAIRRGPMAVPTVGTSVFAPNAYSGTGVDTTITSTGFAPDLFFSKARSFDSLYLNVMVDRLRGASQFLVPTNTIAETVGTNVVLSLNMNGVTLGSGSNANSGTVTYAQWNFKRAPSFMDVVCFTDDGTGTLAVKHNLGVTPELQIVKVRSNAQNWPVYITSGTLSLKLNLTDAAGSQSLSPTSTQFTAPGYSAGWTVVSYLFATCAGVSKVGSYTGTGTTLQIDCGFTGGARFVLIKRTDSTGDWYVWDTARGIVSGNDPYLLLNSTAAEVTNTDYIDTYSAGFEISSTAPSAINASGGSFIFLAIS